MTISLNSTVCAQGYVPASPPPPWILASWIALARAAWTPAALRVALQSGQRVELCPGEWLAWGAEETQ